MEAAANQKSGSDILKPFYQRASEAEDRLSKLEIFLASKKDAGNEELTKMIGEFQKKLEDANAELASEREKVKKHAAENAKLQYRISHLVRAIREGDDKLESMIGGAEAGTRNISKLETLRL